MIRRSFRLIKEFPLSGAVGDVVDFQAEDSNPQFLDVQREHGALPSIFLCDCASYPEYWQEVDLRWEEGTILYDRETDTRLTKDSIGGWISVRQPYICNIPIDDIGGQNKRYMVINIPNIYDMTIVEGKIIAIYVVRTDTVINIGSCIRVSFLSNKGMLGTVKEIYITDFNNICFSIAQNFAITTKLEDIEVAVLRTDDGVYKFMTDPIYCINTNMPTLKVVKIYVISKAYFTSSAANNLKIFDKVENANKYIIDNTKVYSIRDITNAYHTIPKGKKSFRTLIKLLEETDK